MIYSYQALVGALFSISILLTVVPNYSAVILSKAHNPKDKPSHPGSLLEQQFAGWSCLQRVLLPLLLILVSWALRLGSWTINR